MLRLSKTKLQILSVIFLIQMSVKRAARADKGTRAHGMKLLLAVDVGPTFAGWHQHIQFFGTIPTASSTYLLKPLRNSKWLELGT